MKLSPSSLAKLKAVSLKCNGRHQLINLHHFRQLSSRQEAHLIISHDHVQYTFNRIVAYLIHFVDLRSRIIVISLLGYRDRHCRN